MADDLDLSNLPQFLTVPEAARRLKVSEESVRRGIREGRIHAVIIGRGYRVTDSELRRLAKEGTGKPRKGRKKSDEGAPPVDLAGGRRWPGRDARPPAGDDDEGEPYKPPEDQMSLDLARRGGGQREAPASGAPGRAYYASMRVIGE